MRVISHSQRYDHTDPLFKNYKMLKVSDLIKLQTLLFLHKALYSSEIGSNFHFLNVTPNSRRPNDVKVPWCRTSHSQRYVAFRGPYQWNQLPENIKNVRSYCIFKRNVKEFLFSNY